MFGMMIMIIIIIMIRCIVVVVVNDVDMDVVDDDNDSSNCIDPINCVRTRPSTILKNDSLLFDDYMYGDWIIIMYLLINVKYPKTNGIGNCCNNNIDVGVVDEVGIDDSGGGCWF
jgi:hypothetical protein